MPITYPTIAAPKFTLPEAPDFSAFKGDSLSKIASPTIPKIGASPPITLKSVTTSAKSKPYKVTLKGNGSIVRFEASAPVSESRTANYEGFNIVHLPTSLWAYRNTNGRHFSITGKLVSRTPNEAKANASYLTTVRSWMLPDFGNSGAPPPIIFLSGYGNQQLKSVPCILLSYNWSFPEDVDYIYDADEPMPIIGVLTIELEEAYSAAQITNRKWYIGPQDDGEFSLAGLPGTTNADGDKFSLGSSTGPGAIETKMKPNSPFSGLASYNSGFPTLGGALTLSPGIIAKLPSMAGAVIGAATNSPLLSTVAQEAVGLFNNRFVSGSNPQNILNNSSNPSSPTFVGPPAPPPDSFGRSNNLSIPSFGGG